jgi:hypothetical protein
MRDYSEAYCNSRVAMLEKMMPLLGCALAAVAFLIAGASAAVVSISTKGILVRRCRVSPLMGVRIKRLRDEPGINQYSEIRRDRLGKRAAG